MATANGHGGFDAAVRETLRHGVLLTVREVLAAACRDGRLERRHRHVLVEIVDCINGKSGMAFPGRKWLAEKTGLQQSTVASTISELGGFGYILYSRRAPPGGGRALAHYTITCPSVEVVASKNVRIGEKVMAGEYVSKCEVLTSEKSKVVVGEKREVVASIPTVTHQIKLIESTTTSLPAAAQYPAARARDEDHDLQQPWQQRRPRNEGQWRELLQWLLCDDEGRQAPWDRGLYGRLPGEPGYWVHRKVLDEFGGPAAVGEMLAPRAIGKRPASLQPTIPKPFPGLNGSRNGLPPH